MKKIKSFFSDFLIKYKAEKHIIKRCNSMTPLHQKVSYFISAAFCIFLIFFVIFCIHSSADDSITPYSTHEGYLPDDLTGYTVVVPYGWTVSSGYGLYYLTGSLLRDGGSYELLSVPGGSSYSANFGLGYYSDGSFGLFTNAVSANVNVHSGGGGFNIYDGESFGLVVTGGTDSSNASLINWLRENDAVFVPTDSDTISYIQSGYYKLADLPASGVPSVGGFTSGIAHLFETPVEVFYSSGAVNAYSYFGFVVTDFQDSENFSVDFIVQLLDISTPVRIANLTASGGVCVSQFYGGVSNIYFGESFSLDEFEEQLILFTFALDSSFLPDEPIIPDFPNYNPWVYILESIIEALKVPLFGYFSIWDIFLTISGLMLLIWLLKLLAGG